MNRKYKILIISILSSLIFINNSAIAATSQKKIIYETEADFPPFSYMDNGKLTGFDLDLCKMIFSGDEYSVDYTADTWKNVYSDIKSCRIDTCGTLAINESRKKDLLFTKPIMQYHVSIYTLKGMQKVTLKSIKKGNYTIGTVMDNFTEPILQGNLNIKDYKTYPDTTSALNALNKGDINVLFECQEVVNYLIIKNNLRSRIIASDTNLFPMDVAFGVNKNEPELVNYINDKLTHIEKSGIYEELYMNNFFTHSNYYYVNLKKHIAMYTFAAAAFLILILVLLRRYINDLKRKLIASNLEVYKQHTWLRVTLTSIGDAVIATDKDGKIIFLNNATTKLTGFTKKDCEGKKLDEILLLTNNTTNKPVLIDIDFLLNNDLNDNIRNEDTLIAKDGTKYYVTISTSAIINDDEKNVGVVIVIKDITKIKETEIKLTDSYENLEAMHEELTQTEEELRNQYYELLRSQHALEASEERYKISIEGANDGLWDLDLRKKSFFLSPKCLEMCGYDKEMSQNNIKTVLKNIHPDYGKLLKISVLNSLRKRDKFINIEIPVLTKYNGYKWMLCRGQFVFNANGKPVRAAGSLSDISERKKSEEIIEKMAYTDSLTGLPNRASLLETIKKRIADYKHTNLKFVLLFLDLDNFKSINDTRGHYFGDELLIEVSKRLKNCVHKNDTVARIGGDEFMLLLSDIDNLHDVIALVKQILLSLSNPFNIQHHEVNITTSIGITIYPNDGKNDTDLIKNADTAMYKAKESGKNKYEVFSSEFNKAVSEKVELENYLRHAVSKKELVVYYQPQIDIVNGEIVSMEALLRWKHPYLGLIYPDTFISLAEESGLIKPIGEWVLRTACLQNKAFQDAGYKPIRLAVNLSPKQFLDKDLFDKINQSLYETKLDPKYLQLEITESATIQYYDFTIETLKKLRQIGVTISLDDFGTGYSSLNYIKLLPIDEIKIDKSFIQNIVSGGYEESITKSIISIAHDMSVRVVAEGVENEKQLDILKSMNCDIVQGYLFSKPIPIEDFEKLLIK